MVDSYIMYPHSPISRVPLFYRTPFPRKVQERSVARNVQPCLSYFWVAPRTPLDMLIFAKRERSLIRFAAVSVQIHHFLNNYNIMCGYRFVNDSYFDSLLSHRVIHVHGVGTLHYEKKRRMDFGVYSSTISSRYILRFGIYPFPSFEMLPAATERGRNKTNGSTSRFMSNWEKRMAWLPPSTVMVLFST